MLCGTSSARDRDVDLDPVKYSQCQSTLFQGTRGYGSTSLWSWVEEKDNDGDILFFSTEPSQN